MTTKTVMTFEEMCTALNKWYNDPEYIIAFKVHNSIHLIKYGNHYPHNVDEMTAFIRKARSEYKELQEVKE